MSTFLSSLLVFLFTMLKSSGFGAYTIDSKKSLILLYIIFVQYQLILFYMQVAVGSHEWFRNSLVGSSPLSGLDRTGCSCISNVNKDLQYIVSHNFFSLNSFFVRSKQETGGTSSGSARGTLSRGKFFMRVSLLTFLLFDARFTKIHLFVCCA